MEFQNVSVNQPKHDFEVRIVPEDTLQSIDLWHGFTYLTISIDQLIKYVYIFVRKLSTQSREMSINHVIGHYLKH